MTIKNLRYSAKDGAFLASVDIERFGRVFRYPCEVPGPSDMDLALVHGQLRQRALRMSDTPR